MRARCGNNMRFGPVERSRVSTRSARGKTRRAAERSRGVESHPAAGASFSRGTCNPAASTNASRGKIHPAAKARLPGASEVRGANPWLSAWRCPIVAPRKPDRINRAGVFLRTCARAHVFLFAKNEHVPSVRAGSGLDGHTGEEEEEQEEPRSAAAGVGRLRLYPGRRCGLRSNVSVRGPRKHKC